VSYRGRHRRRRPTAMAAPPAVLATAAGITLGLSQVSSAHTGAARDVANSRRLSTVMPAFTAHPSSRPLDRVVTRIAVDLKERHRPQASGPSVRLPRHLDPTTTSIPRRAVAAYVHATSLANAADPACHLSWQVLGGIGFIESGHARSGGSGAPHWNGEASPPIFGPVLDGSRGFGRIADTDDGAIDGNAQWDRAVGPMQFIPSTWARYAADGNQDGTADPQNIDDASLAAAHYLCTAQSDLGNATPLIRAIYSYNHSTSYVRAVLTVAAGYEGVDPAALGINSLPSDQPRRHDHKHRVDHHRHHPKGTPSPHPTHRHNPVTTPTGSPRPTPTPTPTESESGTPTPSPTHHKPKPTSTPTPGGGHLPPPHRSR